MVYRLHCFCQSGNAFKVAAMLDLMGVPWEPVFVDFMNGATRDPSWRETTNEMGEAPVLEDGDIKLTQSGVILPYLSEKHMRYGWLTEAEKWEMMRWILFDNHKFSSYFASYRFLKCFMPKEPDAAVMAWLKGRADAAFAIVEKHLAARHYIVGDRLTIADLSLSAYLAYPIEEHGYDFAKSHPHMARWLQRIRNTPGWKGPYETMPGERLMPLR
jgi:glutathione S-transferase